MSQTENLSFQTEVNQILHLMIHALYSNKEIFLRELVSNAADACDKLRFLAVENAALYESAGITDSELRVRVSFDKLSKTISINDNGIGLSRAEAIENLGTIAKSGTKQFLQSLTGDQKKDANLIGQFGVGFYSSFIVADQVVVESRKAGAPANEGVRWTSSLSDKADENKSPSGYTIDTINRPERGTTITLHLKEGEMDFADHFRLRHLITQYSDHISFPVQMQKPDSKGEVAGDAQWEAVNRANALWLRPKNEIKEEEYQQFYQHIAHDWENPIAWSHNKVEGKLEYTSLLFIPSRPPFDLWEAKPKHGVKIFVKRVFIMDDVEHVLPRYLRFVRGVIDSNDLPLNVSREMLQGSKVMDSIRSAAIKRVLSMLAEMAENKPTDYQTCWNHFGRVLKEGVIEDRDQQETLMKLMRFATTRDDSPNQTRSLADYLANMKEGQDKIYYLTAENHQAAKNSPHLEIFRKHSIEVLLLSDRVDEWLVRQVSEFEGKSWQSVADGKLDVASLPGEDKKAIERVDGACKALIERLSKALTEKVKEVKISHRLTSSPACIVLADGQLARYMKEWFQQAGQAAPDQKPILEINPDHPLLVRMNLEIDETKFARWAKVVLDQAILAEGGQLDDPAEFVKNLNGLMFAH